MEVFHSIRSNAVRRVGLALLLSVAALTGCRESSRPLQNAENDTARPKVKIDFRYPSDRYDLGHDESLGGHTLSRHVARTDAQLAERLEQERNISAASTWTDRNTAEETVAQALQAEHGRIESWIARGYPRANLALHFSAGREIGRSLRRGETQTVPCMEAVIVLRADSEGTFYVLTTYPEARQ